MPPKIVFSWSIHGIQKYSTSPFLIGTCYALIHRDMIISGSRNLQNHNPETTIKNVETETVQVGYPNASYSFSPHLYVDSIIFSVPH